MAKKGSKSMMGILGIVFGILVILNPDILGLLVGVYLIITGAANLLT